MSEKVVVRDATFSDALVITQLSVTTFAETFAADNKKEDMDKYIREEMSYDKIAAEVGDGANSFFLVEVAGVAAGFAKVRSIKHPAELEGTRSLEIERLYALKAHHGKRIGAALMQKCLDHAARNNFHTIWLGVWEHNHKAIEFYKRWGFEFFSSHVFKLGDDEQTDLMMKKEIKFDE